MIDCHAHLSLQDFDSDRKQVIERALSAGVKKILVVGEDFKDNLKVLDICRQFPQTLIPCLGLHPDRFSDIYDASDMELEDVCDLIAKHKQDISAIGEVGLDHWVTKTKAQRLRQQQVFERFVDLSIKLDIPLNVHCRSAGRHTLEVLKEHKAKKVLMHAFDGKASYAKAAFLEQGWLFSIPPSVVRSPQKQKLVRNLPLEAMALESDSPVLGPERENRNEPANLIGTVTYIASIKKIDTSEVIGETTNNALNLFNLRV